MSSRMRRRYDAGGEIINYKRRIKRNRRRRRTLLFFFLTVIILFTVFRAPFFAISRIDLRGTQVTATVIQDYANTLVGKNINWYSLSSMGDTIAQIPYIDTVRVTRHFPNILRITITERIPFSQINIGDTYYLIDKDGRVLESSHEEFEAIHLFGVAESPSEYVTDVNTLFFQNYTALAHAITEHNMTDIITWIDLSDILNMRFQMGDILVKVGTAERLDYKFQRLIDIRTELPGHIRGTLDITNGARAYFREEFR